MSDFSTIRIRGARQHNLKNVDLDLPRNALVVITGPSGSGKSSLAFDTLFAEGQRRYVQSLSAYARQFLDQTDKPDVDSIEGLSPAVAIEQRTAGTSPRSIVATVTEIYDYLRILYASQGRPHHPETGRLLQRLSTEEIVEKILLHPEADRFTLLAPVVRGEKGEFRDVLQKLRREGFVRARVDGQIVLLDEPVKMDRKKAHQIEAVVDRLKIDPSMRMRLTDSVELALRVGDGVLHIAWHKNSAEVTDSEWVLSNQNYDPETGYHFPEITPRHFSFNNPQGACPVCHGLGTRQIADPDLLVPDTSLSLEAGALPFFAKAPKKTAASQQAILDALAKRYKAASHRSWKDLPEGFRNAVLFGEKEGDTPFPGLISIVTQMAEEAESPLARRRVDPYLSRQPCPACHGRRLRPEILAVRLPLQDGMGPDIYSLCEMSVSAAHACLGQVPAPESPAVRDVLREATARLEFLRDVGLDYLTLTRETGTLSGGEAQRIRLATQIGAGLTGVLYILDEPSIGLHQRDNERLLKTLKILRDIGNTVIVVEHDEETMREADYLVDVGPSAGARGGHIVAAGTVAEVLANPKSVTGPYLNGIASIPVPKHRRKPNGHLIIRGAEENNLKNIDVSFPIGCLTCVTGVSGSGKSTLVNDVLSRALFRHFHGSKEKPGKHRSIDGIHQLDKVLVIDQSPIGRSPRSNALTYTGAFNGIRELFAQLPSSRIRGYDAGRFSANTPGGRCEHCEGDGWIRIEMHFLPDAYVVCDACKGKRFNRETLEITYKGKNIADVLAMTVDDGLTLFKNVPGVEDRLLALAQVGLGYLPLGQPATTLSGGEAQRIKLATELARKATGRTCFILDEPTTGLHFLDIEQLLRVLQELRDAGNTMIVIEHQLDVIKSSDHVIDLGPEGGSGGGRVVVAGTPEEVARCPESHTGRFLRNALKLK